MAARPEREAHSPDMDGANGGSAVRALERALSLERGTLRGLREGNKNQTIQLLNPFHASLGNYPRP